MLQVKMKQGVVIESNWEQLPAVERYDAKKNERPQSEGNLVADLYKMMQKTKFAKPFYEPDYYKAYVEFQKEVRRMKEQRMDRQRYRLETVQRLDRAMPEVRIVPNIQAGQDRLNGLQNGEVIVNRPMPAMWTFPYAPDLSSRWNGEIPTTTADYFNVTGTTTTAANTQTNVASATISRQTAQEIQRSADAAARRSNLDNLRSGRF